MKPTWETADGSIRLYCADCMDVLPTLEGVDAVVTDPPYGVGKNYLSFDDTEENAVAVSRAALEACRIIAPRVLMFSGIRMLWELPKPDWCCAWAWVSTGSYGKVGVNQWQPLLFYGTDISGFGSVNGVIKSDFKYFNDGIGSGFLAERVNHPCPKIRKVMDWCVSRFSNEADVVLDPFMGSGTTGVACVRTGRKFIGIEKEEKYFAIAVNRIEAELNRNVLFEKPPEVIQRSLLEKESA